MARISQDDINNFVANVDALADLLRVVDADQIVQGLHIVVKTQALQAMHVYANNPTVASLLVVKDYAEVLEFWGTGTGTGV